MSKSLSFSFYASIMQESKYITHTHANDKSNYRKIVGIREYVNFTDKIGIMRM